jgi:HAD superfamily hydrolase (TIGR01490 family)
MIVALFDADGTLYSAQYGRGLMKYALAHGRRLHAAAYFASLVPASIPVALKLTHNEGFDRAKISRMARLLRGWKEDQGRRAFEWVTDEFLLPTRREPVIARLRAHQEAGHLVVIASGTFTPSLQVLGERLGVSNLIGTGIEIRNGHYTGNAIPPVIKGADKLTQIQAHLSQRGLTVDWQASHAYGDSYSDREFMQLTGHPVAVHPEDRLRKLALDRKWEILESRPSA